MYIALTGSENNKDVYIYHSFRKENGKSCLLYTSVATSGRNGNQRKAVPGYLCTNLWNGAASSGNDFKQRTWILYRAACKCSTYDRG